MTYTELIEGKPLSAFPRPTKIYRSATHDYISLKNSGFVGKDKTVLVTGGATGVGFAIAEAFAKAVVRRVILVSRTQSSLDEAKELLESQFPNVEILVISASVTAYDRMTEVLHKTHAKYGIDILIHSAVGINDAIPVEKMPLSMVEDVFATNVFGAFNLFKAYGSLNHPTGKTIINVSSASAGILFPFNSIYGASKAAAAQIVQHLSAEQATKPQNERTRIFSFHPGQFFTSLVSKYVKKDWVNWDDIELAGDYAVWLAGTHSDFLQGRFTWATWDMEELLLMKEKIAEDPHLLTISLIL